MSQLHWDLNTLSLTSLETREDLTWKLMNIEALNTVQSWIFCSSADLSSIINIISGEVKPAACPQNGSTSSCSCWHQNNKPPAASCQRSGPAYGNTYIFLLVGSDGCDVSGKATIAASVNLLVEEPSGDEADPLLPLLQQGGLHPLDLQDLGLNICREDGHQCKTSSNE